MALSGLADLFSLFFILYCFLWVTNDYFGCLGFLLILSAGLIDRANMVWSIGIYCL
jgi:hypothetical protein